nr:hypothetical protein BaRGS_020879 [Batillaria attramentaria]
MDSHFSSPELFEDLKDRGTRAVGTVRTGREGIPEEMHPKNIKLQKNESIFRRKGDLLCLRLKDKKDVFFLSTVHTTEKERVGNDRQGNVRLKIKLVNDYNKKMKGVDQFDQNLSRPIKREKVPAQERHDFRVYEV